MAPTEAPLPESGRPTPSTARVPDGELAPPTAPPPPLPAGPLPPPSSAHSWPPSPPSPLAAPPPSPRCYERGMESTTDSSSVNYGSTLDVSPDQTPT